VNVREIYEKLAVLYTAESRTRYENAYVNVVLIRIVEITLRECRFGGSETRWLSTRILYIVFSLRLRDEIARRECRFSGYKTRWLWDTRIMI